MSESLNTALARRWFDEVWNRRLDATVRELLRPDSIGHLEGLVTRGVDEFFAARSILLGAFPDLHVKVEDTVAQGDRVAIRWSATGTHGGDQLGFQATGRSASFRGITWLIFAEGHIVEGWDAWNQQRLLAELRPAEPSSFQGAV